MSGETDLATLLATMQPDLHADAYEFVTVVAPTEAEIATAMVVVREREGVTLVRANPGTDTGAMACITLSVHSSLQAVGMTAAVSAALAAESIPCNVVAGFHHDHLFVPFARRADAMAALQRLSRRPGGVLGA